MTVEREEVCVLVESPDEARTVSRLNRPAASSLLRERFRALSKEGELREDQMPDVLRELETKRLEARRLRVVVDGFEVNLRDGVGEILMDGAPVRGVQELTIKLGVNRLPEVTMTVLPVREG